MVQNVNHTSPVKLDKLDEFKNGSEELANKYKNSSD